MLVAYGDFIFQLPQSLGLGLYGTKTIFFIALFLGWALIFMTSPKEALDVDTFMFIPLFTVISSLQLECMLSLSLSLLLSLSITSALHSSALLSILFTIVCVEVPLLPSEKEFLFQNILATLFFNEGKGHNSSFHLLSFNVLVYTSSLKVCSPDLVLTFKSTSIMCSGRTHVKLFFRKS